MATLQIVRLDEALGTEQTATAIENTPEFVGY